MKNQRKKIVAVVLLVLILVLGGASIFVATRLNTTNRVAPNAPQSQPKASTGANTCAPCTEATGATVCLEGTVCVSGFCNFVAPQTPVTCSTWASCTLVSATVSAGACTARLACLDESPIPSECDQTAPAGGYCPYLACDNNKTVKIFNYIGKDTDGSYLLSTTNEITGTAANPITLNPGKEYVYLIPYKMTGIGDDKFPFNEAKIVSTLDARLQFIDGSHPNFFDCAIEATTNTLTCTVTKTGANIDSFVVYRVKVNDTTNYSALSNNFVIKATKTGGVSMGAAQCHSSAVVAVAPSASLSCNSVLALNDSGSSILNSLSTDQTFTYSFNLINNGNQVATNVVLTDSLSSGQLIFVDSASGCTIDTATKLVSCSIPSMAAGATKIVSFRAKTVSTLTDRQTVSNTGVVKLASDASTVVGSQCQSDMLVALPHLTVAKNAYLDNTNNQVGNYTLSTSIDSVSKNQTFVYSAEMTNTGSGTSSATTINDPLNGLAQDQLTFVDSDPRCTWSAADKVLICHVDVQPGGTERAAFRVKVSDGIANGTVIKNVAKVLSLGQEQVIEKDLTVSTVVGCNNTCTTQAECQTGYVCDTTSSKCRLSACLTTESCVCPAIVTTTPTPLVIVVTPTPTKVATQAPTKAVAQATQAPAELPSTGILDIPGVAAFGGGLVLAVVGLLLAL